MVNNNGKAGDEDKPNLKDSPEDRNRPIDTINVYNYVLANFRKHKLRYGLTIFGLIICVVFFIIIASLSIGLYEPTEPELPTETETPADIVEKPGDEVVELDQDIKRTIVNWLYATSVLIFGTATASVANTMLISMIERKHEIGILKSVGFTKRQIIELFFVETFTICLLAFSIGVLIGLHMANNIFNYFSGGESKYLFFGTMRTPPVVIFAAFIIVFVVGILAAILPAYRAAKLTPIDALRG